MRRPARMLAPALAAALFASPLPARAEGSGSRWIAALPFGIGQFQNGDVGLGALLAASQAALAGTSIATSVIVHSLAATPMGGHPVVDVPALNADMATLTAVNRAAFVGWAALAVAGVVEAEVSYGPRHAEPGPPGALITATVAPVLGGGVVGVRGTF